MGSALTSRVEGSNEETVENKEDSSIVESEENV